MILDAVFTEENQTINAEFGVLTRGEKGEQGERGEKGEPGEVNIDDSAVLTDSTWSSKKIVEEIGAVDEFSAIVSKASGEILTLSDSSNRELKGLTLYGKTTQNGTPTPEAPVELVSAGNGGSITVNVTGENDIQSMTIATPNGLPGIPVSSGGNYTDENGQQWICDEINFANGVRVQNIGNHQIINPVYSGAVNYRPDSPVQQINYTVGVPNVKQYECMSPWFAYNANTTSGMSAGCKMAGNIIVMGVSKELLHGYGAVAGNTASYGTAFIAWANELKAAGTPLEFLYILATPIETTLSAEELAQYAALHTNKPNTTVYNDAGAGLAVEYVADTKLYIDQKLAAISAALLNT